MTAAGLAAPLVAIAAAPLFVGVIHRTKAVFAGRTGQPLFQLYFDLAKLLGKGAVLSRTTTWVFAIGPALAITAPIAALALLPQGGIPALVAFSGDFVLLAALLGAARFFTIISALDTGSSFEGMGAYTSLSANLVGEGEPQRLEGVMVTSELLPLLGVQPVIGPYEHGLSGGSSREDFGVTSTRSLPREARLNE